MKEIGEESVEGVRGWKEGKGNIEGRKWWSGSEAAGRAEVCTRSVQELRQV